MSNQSYRPGSSVRPEEYKYKPPKKYYWLRRNWPGLIITVALLSIAVYYAEREDENVDTGTPELQQQYVILESEVTAYNALEWQTDSTPNENAWGKVPKLGDIACPIQLNFGTMVVIDNVIYTCADRMAKKYRTGNYFDIFMEDLQSAREWGRQTKLVEVIIDENTWNQEWIDNQVTQHVRQNTN